MARKTRKSASVKPAPPLRLERFSKPSWLFAFALAAALIAFGPALHGSFVFDDFHLPFADPKAAQMPVGFWLGGVRPVLILTYWANFLLSGTDTLSYHVVNVVLHAATGLLVFAIFERILSLSGAVRNTKAWALAGAAIFLLHPLQTESVAYIAGRSEVVSGLLFCAAWLVFLTNFEIETKVATSLKILLLSGAAVLAKENAICLPAVLLATDIFWSGRPIAEQMRRRIKLYIPFLFGAVVASIAILRSLSAGTAAGAASGIGRFQYALTECRVIFIYMRLFLFPAGQNGDWHLPVFHSLADGAAWLYVLAILAFFAGIFLLYSRVRLAAYGLLIFLLTLAPTSSLVPVSDALAERRMYIPIAGLILAFIAFLTRLNLKPGALRAMAVAFVLIAAALTWHRSAVWSGPQAFWENSVSQNPLNPRAHLGWGSALLANHDCKTAIREFSLGRSEDPSNPEMDWNLAQAYRCNHQPQLALASFRAFVSAHPTADAWNEIAYTAAQLNRPDEVTTAVANALSLDPNNATSHAYQGLEQLALNNPDGARADFQRALELDPHNQVALDGMQRVAELQGR